MKKMNDKEKMVHKSVLRDLMRAMEDDMYSEMAPRAMKKVTVVAKDKEGLKKGLEKAEEVMEGMSEGEESEEMPCKECGKGECECPEMEESKVKEASLEEPSELDMLKQKVKELEAKLAAKSSQE